MHTNYRYYTFAFESIYYTIEQVIEKNIAGRDSEEVENIYLEEV